MTDHRHMRNAGDVPGPGSEEHDPMEGVAGEKASSIPVKGDANQLLAGHPCPFPSCYSSHRPFFLCPDQVVERDTRPSHRGDCKNRGISHALVVCEARSSMFSREEITHILGIAFGVAGFSVVLVLHVFILVVTGASEATQ